MNDNEYWIRLWKVAAVALIGLVTVIAGCNAHQVEAVKRMTDKGANPLDAACAVGGSERLCAIRYATK